MPTMRFFFFLDLIKKRFSTTYWKVYKTNMLLQLLDESSALLTNKFAKHSSNKHRDDVRFSNPGGQAVMWLA